MQKWEGDMETSACKEAGPDEPECLAYQGLLQFMVKGNLTMQFCFSEV